METFVARADLECLLARIEREAADPRAGIFGPASLTWKVSRESALFLGAGRAALLQLAHPWVSAALAEHSSLLADPIARFHNTFRIVFVMIFGSLNQALAAARHLHTLHSSIRGELAESVAAWPRGSHYEANEISALRWVYATLIESAMLAYQTVLPLAVAEREQYYQESKTMAALFGIPAEALPKDWAAFEIYNRKMLDSGALGVSPQSRAMANAVLSGAGSWIHPPPWYRALTADWMPPRLREEFGLKSDDRAADRARRRLPQLYRLLLGSARFVGPYHEADARLRNRPPGLLAQWSNRFWTGQTTLPFANR